LLSAAKCRSEGHQSENKNENISLKNHRGIFKIFNHDGDAV